jgi:hypothetical protein
VDYIEPAVAQRDPLDQGELVVAIHVSEPLDTFVPGSPVELSQDSIAVVADIAQMAGRVSAAVDFHAAVRGALDLMQELHFQR